MKDNDKHNFTNGHEELGVPGWVPIGKLWRVFSSLGFPMCSFVVNFASKEYYVFDAGAQLFPDSLVFEDEYTVLWKTTPADERHIMVNHAKALRSFVASQVPVTDRERMSVIERFHVCWNGIKTMMVRKCFPLDIDDDGNTRIGFFLMVPCPDECLGELTVSYGDSMWEYDESSDSFKEQKRMILSVREMQMLLLSVSGAPIKNIAELMDVTEGTVKCYRNRAFRKSDAKSVLEAIVNLFLYTL